MSARHLQALRAQSAAAPPPNDASQPAISDSSEDDDQDDLKPVDWAELDYSDSSSSSDDEEDTARNGTVGEVPFTQLRGPPLRKTSHLRPIRAAPSPFLADAGGLPRRDAPRSDRVKPLQEEDIDSILASLPSRCPPAFAARAPFLIPKPPPLEGFDIQPSSTLHRFIRHYCHSYTTPVAASASFGGKQVSTVEEVRGVAEAICEP